MLSGFTWFGHLLDSDSTSPRHACCMMISVFSTFSQFQVCQLQLSLTADLQQILVPLIPRVQRGYDHDLVSPAMLSRLGTEEEAGAVNNKA